MAQQLTDDERVALQGIRALLNTVRKEDPEMPAQTLLAFVEIALEPNISMADLRARLDVASSTSTRIVYRLTEWERHKKPGRDWVVKRPDPMDRRFELVEPNAKGMGFARKLAASLQATIKKIVRDSKEDG